jgi:hypothetical protein
LAALAPRADDDDADDPGEEGGESGRDDDDEEDTELGSSERLDPSRARIKINEKME